MKIPTKRWRRQYSLGRAIARNATFFTTTVFAMIFVWFASNASIAADDRPVILFIGTSLTAGYGLPSQEAFPSLIQKEVDAAGLNFRVVNAGVSGDTSAGGLRRIDWLLQSPVSVLVLELGANDMLRGLDPDAMRQNLTKIIERTRAANPNAKLLVAGMRAAPNLGSTYIQKFESTYTDLASQYAAQLIPFLLEDVAARPGLNQVDGIHPTAEGHKLIAKRVWGVLQGMLRQTVVPPQL